VRMGDRTTMAVCLSIFISFSAVLFAGLASVCIIDDVSDFYDEAMREMSEFQKLTDDAWVEVLPMAQSGPAVKESRRVANPSIASLFRTKRQVELPSQCNCNIHQNSCPPGPPGDRGYDGAPGANGEPGAAGPNGVDGPAGVMTYSTPRDCIVCPAGPVGPQGSPGNPGAAGLPGMPGPKGEGTYAGRGQPGPPGPPG
ncbi:hypothetical protein PENTCL1PPCAC_17030, partial [Pristionchus entomophagus]